MSAKCESAAAKRPISQFSVRNKLDAIQRVHNGESKASVARSIGVPESTLRGWCKSEDKLRNVAKSCGFPEDSLHSESDKDATEDTGQSEYKRSRLEEDLPRVVSSIGTHSHPHLSAIQQQTDVNEAIMFWIKQQQQVGIPLPVHGLLPSLETKKPLIPEKETTHDSWFWKWYKRCGYSQFSTQGDAINSNGDMTNEAQKVNGYSVPESGEKSTLDTLLHNNNVPVAKTEESDEDDDEDEPPATAAEAVGHGEKFLRWLECCSDPSVTAMQILQFRYLLNNVRACAERKARQAKTKERSRRK